MRCLTVPSREDPAKQVWLTLGTGNPPSFRAPVISRRPAAHLRNLVLVACHAVFIGSDYSMAEDPDAWLLLDYQKVKCSLPLVPHSFEAVSGWLCMHHNMHFLHSARHSSLCEVQQLHLYLTRYQAKHIPSSNTFKQAYSMLSMIQAPCCCFLEARHARLQGPAVRRKGTGW